MITGENLAIPILLEHFSAVVNMSLKTTKNAMMQKQNKIKADGNRISIMNDDQQIVFLKTVICIFYSNIIIIKKNKYVAFVTVEN